ncbi:spore coat protein U domain-containing protein [Diaphorobacter ruginosibacter]|uniref:Spore coat protein U domain-containing protein n=1 Tax=Diaphorobacter ruginosibacter TaxID=1715720 RepID=A0A7G9RQ70_9BURK|nr:spore coat protein U domain-containing protein [Diaphorobacter ruginosibacter]QNN57745.1 spore coat protein U domain-containing protein [Diaphorobacter ruginosibacter]
MSLTRFALIGAIAAASLASVAPAQAASVNQTFNVKITIVSKCVFGTTTIADIDYGTNHVPTVLDASQSNLGGQTSFTVQCTKTTPYSITMQPAGASTTGTGTLKGPGGDTIAYSLYQDAAHNTPWGTTTGTGGNALGGTGTGLVSSAINVYSLIPTIGTVQPGTYTDLVTVAIVY